MGNHPRWFLKPVRLANFATPARFLEGQEGLEPPMQGQAPEEIKSLRPSPLGSLTPGSKSLEGDLGFEPRTSRLRACRSDL